MEANLYFLHLSLGWALAGQGRHDEAVEACRQAAVAAPAEPIVCGYLSWALGLAGQRQEALRILKDLERRRNEEYVSGVLMAQARLGLGEPDQAISWLQQAAEEHDGLLTLFLNVWFGVDALRADPRFQALLRRMNFPETAASS